MINGSVYYLYFIAKTWDDVINGFTIDKNGIPYKFMTFVEVDGSIVTVRVDHVVAFTKVSQEPVKE